MSQIVGPVESTKVVSLYLHHEHFDVITSLPAFFGRSYSCPACNKGYNTKEDHKCNRTGCAGCHQEKPCQFEDWALCPDCNRYLPSRQCFDNHRTSLSDLQPSTSKKPLLLSVCEKLKRCFNCNQLVDSGHSNRHICDQVGGRTHLLHSGMFILVNLLQNFHCFQPIKEEEKKKKTKKQPTFIFFDFETRQDLKVDENQHGAIFVRTRLADGERVR